MHAIQTSQPLSPAGTAPGVPTVPARPRRGVVSRLLAAVVVAGLATACMTDGSTGPKTAIGTLAGAGLGGWAGSKVGGGRGQLAAVAVGALAGAFVGNGIGESLDRADRMYAERATYQASRAPVGQTIQWSNPDTGNYGAVTPVRDGYQSGTGAYCREYQTDIVVGGEMQRGYGTACRQPDGSWKVAS
jgi:surface antigen